MTQQTKLPIIDLDAAIDPLAEPEALAGQPAKKGISLYSEDGSRKSQPTLLIELGQVGSLFHDPGKNGYAIVGGKVVMALRSRDYKEHLSHEFFRLTGKGCNANALADALATLESIAKYDSPLHEVYTRVANLDSAIYLDLGCHDWRAIEVTAAGWRILEESPVKFVRKPGAVALPEPSQKGGIGLLSRYVNIEASQLPLVVGWLLCALAGVKPYPILILQGEQGTGKSTTSRVLRSLVDPSAVPLRSPPKDPRDLLVSAGNNHVVVLDNLSGLSPELSDCLCRLSTGGGIDIRALYTDNEQVLMDIQRPVLINGIDDVATRPDLAERALIISLPVIGGGDRKGERDFWREFEADKPGIFGALLNALVAGLKHRDTVRLPFKPRMADMAQFVTACEHGGLGRVGAFMAAHEANQTEAIEQALESSPVGSAIMALMSERDRWTGKPTELLAALADIAGDTQAKSKAWPQSPKGLANTIKRLMPGLRKIGISVEESRTREARLYELGKVCFYPSHPSQASRNGYSPELAGLSAVTDNYKNVTDSPSVTDAIRHGDTCVTDSHLANPLITLGGDACDTCDGYKPTYHVLGDGEEVRI